MAAAAGPARRPAADLGRAQVGGRVGEHERQPVSGDPPAPGVVGRTRGEEHAVGVVAPQDAVQPRPPPRGGPGVGQAAARVVGLQGGGDRGAQPAPDVRADAHEVHQPAEVHSGAPQPISGTPPARTASRPARWASSPVTDGSAHVPSRAASAVHSDA